MHRTLPPFCPIPSLSHVRAEPLFDVRAARDVASSWGVGTKHAVIFQCPQTGMRFRAPGSVEEIARFYGADYHDRMAGEAASDERRAAYRLENRERIEHLKRFCEGGTVLDVGCSSGVFAEQLAQAGFDVFGSDISAYACEQAKERLGSDRVLCGDVSELAERFRGRLDAVTLMDVIEHFVDVVTPLETMLELLRPGGVLFLRTPTLRSPFFRLADLSYRLSGGRYQEAVLKIYHAEHFYFFNEESIERLLTDVGFELLAIDPDPLLWQNFRTAEMRQGFLVNSVLGAVYFVGRAVGRGHGMKVVARRPL